uniref:Uncharacterized protein n=1 Tax=Anguilla anguilla TaxID=7936 RepID=A0A0E9RS82_ANGAN
MQLCITMVLHRLGHPVNISAKRRTFKSTLV